MGKKNPNKPINYYDVSMEEIASFQKEGKKPSIAIHACCGPCACYPLVFLADYFSHITILYVNPNIYPKEEYIRRKEELKRYVEGFNKEHETKAEVVEFDYDNDPYNQEFLHYGDQEEGKERCQACYRYRMKKAYDYADTLGVDYFTTIMTISRQKSSKIMNEIGKDLEKDHKTKYFYSDFKKHDGLNKGKAIRLQYNMYNQQYCGCHFSYERYLKRLERQKKEAGEETSESENK